MKKLVLFGAVAMACGVAFAQDKIVSACAKPGDFSQKGEDVLLCGSQGWEKFSTAGDKSLRVTYSLSEDGKVVESGFIFMRDGTPASHRAFHVTTYAAGAKKNPSGKTVITQADVETGHSLTLVPVVTTDGTIKMYVSMEYSVLISLDPVSVGDLTIQKPVVTRVGSTQHLVMDQSKEMVISLPHATSDGNAMYTLKLVATAI